MKAFLRIVVMVLLFTLVVAGGSKTPQADTRVQELSQMVIYSTPPLDLRFVRIGDEDPSYYIVGQFTLCDSLLNVKVCTIDNESDSTREVGVLTTYDVGLTNDCPVERFVFMFHGGVVRRQLEKEGCVVLVIGGTSRAVIFQLNAAGEAGILEVITRKNNGS